MLDSICHIMWYCIPENQNFHVFCSVSAMLSGWGRNPEPTKHKTGVLHTTCYTYWGSHSCSWQFKFSACDAIPPDELFPVFQRIKVPASSGSCSSRSCFTLKMKALWSLGTSGGIIPPLTHCHIPRWSQCSTAMRFSQFFKVLSEKLKKKKLYKKEVTS
jgi:hypothetical protein